MNYILLFILIFNFSFSNVILKIESLTTQNEYTTTYSGSEYLQGTLEIGVTTDEDISGFSMGISHYNNMGVGQAYGGLVEEYDFEMNNIFGALITGGHNMFPQDYYIPAGTTDETLMYVPILISETNDEEFCIQPGDFISPWGGSLNVILNENSCISIDEMTVSGMPVAVINSGLESTEADMGSIFTLDATSSFDPDGNIRSYFWSQSSQGTQVEFSSVNEAITTFIIPTEENDDVVCNIWLTVTDNDGNTAMSELTITGIENSDPVGLVSLTIESLTTQNEYETWESGEYLIGTLEIGITTDQDISSIQMGISQYNTMGTGAPYGGFVEELDWYAGSLLGSQIFGYHYMFPEEYFIPAGTTNETLMYVPIRISEENDEEFCIISPNFSNTEWNSLNVILDENSCISIDEMCLDEDYDGECDIASINGDMNSDNVIDVLDLIQIVNISLGTEDFNLDADLNEDGEVNVLDVVSLVNSILGLSRVNYHLDTKATLDNNTLNLEGPIGGIQFTGNLISNLDGDDVIASNNGKSIIYNLNGILNTKVFTFKNAPNDLIVSSSSAERVNVDAISPQAFILNSVYPNPFNPSTTVSYSIENNINVNISIYNMSGQKVSELVNANQAKGDYSITWDANNQPSGLYFVRLSAGNQISSQNIMLVK